MTQLRPTQGGIRWRQSISSGCHVDGLFQVLGRATRRAFGALIVLAVAAMLLAGAGAARADQEFLDPQDAFAFSAAMAGPNELDVHFRIAPDYYMYRERFEFELTPDSSRLGTPVFPTGIVKYDPTFEKNLEVYHDQVTIRLPILDGAAEPLKLAVTSQGCANAGLCYAPITTELELKPEPGGGYSAAGPGVVARVPAMGTTSGPDGPSGAAAGQDAAPGFGAALDLGDMGFASYLATAGWGRIIVLCLLLGVLLSFTPCVLPMVPILLAVVAGDADKGRARGRWRGLSLAAAYVLGMSLVYTALGIAAGLIGASLSAWLQTPWVLALFAVLLALLALAMFGVFTLQAPAAMQTALSQKVSRIPGGRHGGAFVMGMVSALIVGPCVAAPLAGVLLFISQTGDLVLGGSALFALAWGQGLLLLAVGASSRALLPRAGPWMEGVKRLFGILLLATAWWMVDSIMPAALALLGWAFLALWSAAMLRAFDAAPADAGPGQFLLKAAGLLLALWAVLTLVGMAAGGRSLLQPLQPFTAGLAAPGAGSASSAGPDGAAASDPSGTAAKAAAPAFVKVYSSSELDILLSGADRPVMLDFYADWCVSCVEMERFTYTDPAVAAKMSQMLLIQADVTKNTFHGRELLKRFKLFGPPGIIFFDARGRPLPDTRVIGFKNAAKFGAVLDDVLSAADKSP